LLLLQYDNCYTSRFPVTRVPAINALKTIMRQTLISHRIGTFSIRNQYFQVEPGKRLSSEMK